MHIAMCGPVSLRLLEEYVEDGKSVPEGYACPLIAYLVRKYIQMGHYITIVTGSTDVHDISTWKGKRCSIIVTPRRKRPRDVVKDFYRNEVGLLSDELKKINPDIIHAQWTYEFADAALSSGLPTVVTAHDSPFRIAWIMKHPYWWIRASYATFWNLPRIRNLTTVSGYMKGEIHKHGYLRSITVVPNGISEERFCEFPVFGLKAQERIRIYCVAEWNNIKNIKTLLHAFSILRAKRNNTILVLVGKELGKGEAAFQYSVRQKLTDGVVYAGYQSQEWVIRKLREEADLFISPTIEESFGMIFVEAMSQGVACIGGLSSGAVPWVLDHGKAGFLVDVKDGHRMAESILQILDDPLRIATVAACGYKRAKDLFTLDSVAKQYLAVFERVLDQKKRNI
jgi:L-malate glycosyltransferase